MKTFTKIGLIAVLLTALSSNSYGWAEHYLMTAKAVDKPGLDFLDKEVQTTELAGFVSKNKVQLSKLFKDYYGWLDDTLDRDITEAYLTEPFRQNKVKDAASAQLEFLRATRLHPKSFFPLVNRIMPGSKRRYPPARLGKVSPYLPVSQKFFTEFEDVANRRVSLRSVLVTFSDEPDWQMDHSLWDVKEYNYGDVPYGKKHGVTSKAAFHTQFNHEPLVISLFMPQIEDGMVHDRVELYTRLAKFALQSGDEYWAYRFAAWAIHYVQDLCQPYHARLLPSAGFTYYLDYLFTWDKEAFKKRTLQVMSNRHFAYEGFVAYILTTAYTEPGMANSQLATSLTAGRDYENVPSAYSLVEDIMSWSAGSAPQIDRKIKNEWGSLLHRHDYHVLRDYRGELEKKLRQTDHTNSELVDFTRSNFAKAGRVTRTMVKLMRSR